MKTNSKTPKAVILYVDDEPENLEGFKAVFRRDYDVHLAHSAREALAILDRIHIQVLITDQRMPEMSGSDLLEAAAKKHPDMVRIMLTGFSDLEPVVDAINRGRLQGYFSKPLDVDLLKRHMEKCLAVFYLKLKNEALHETLRQSEARLRSIFDQAAIGIAALENDGRFRMANKKLCDMLGIREDEPWGKTLHQIIPHDDVNVGGDRLKALLENRITSFHVESRVRRHNHDRGWVAMTLSAVRAGDGSAESLIAIVEDITRRMVAEKEKERLVDRLQQARKMEAIGALASGVAHDFNNILGPIVGYSELIAAEASPETAHGEYARRISTAGFRARDLVRQILTFSRGREGEKTPMLVQLVVKEALKLLRASLPATVALNRRIDNNCGPIMGDPTRIYQVIVNLCTNAHQAIQGREGLEGRIELIVDEFLITDENKADFMEVEPGPFIRVSVSDNGPGVDPAVKARIFDPYFTTKRMKSGTGLGLSIVHGIVKGHGGAIKVNSEAGRGATFSIYLPRMLNDKTTPVIGDDGPTPGGDESILLVDDEDAVVHVVQDILEKLGYKVSGFSDSREALAHFKRRPDACDLVICDMTMPHLTGLAFAEAILSVNPKTPIVIITGRDGREARAKAAEAGVRRVVVKPIIKSEIALTLREVLEGK
ncbi:MAG: response regulator [Desulfobacterales bacterium]|nr:response regulator [Desulfobacterales bacterium]